MTHPKILTLDIETAPLELYAWRLGDDYLGVDNIKTDWSILSYAAKWLSTGKVYFEHAGGRGVGKVRDDRRLLRPLWQLLDDAEIVVAQNGSRFDVKKINARFIISGLAPYSPIRVVDTLSASRKYFGFTSNKLAYTSSILTDTPKEQHRKYPGIELWKACLADDPKAWAEMRKYNIRDVVATEKKYLALRPWLTNHPNLGAYFDGDQHNCPNCASSHVTKQGSKVTQQGRRQQYKCQKCGAWSSGKQQIISPQRRKALLKS